MPTSIPTLTSVTLLVVSVTSLTVIVDTLVSSVAKLLSLLGVSSWQMVSTVGREGSREEGGGRGEGMEVGGWEAVKDGSL